MTTKKATKQTTKPAMTYKERLKAGLVKYRSDSDKAKVYREYCVKGEEAAKRLCTDKLKKSPQTFNAWKGDWKAIAENNWPSPLEGVKAEKPKATPKATKGAAKKAPARKKATKARTTKKRASAA